MTGIVLAGGQSRRMGCDKSNLPWGRTTLLEHILGVLRPITDELMVSVKKTNGFHHLDAKVVEDLVPDAHALGGLYTGIRSAEHDLCFVCACDAPWLSVDLIEFLKSQAEDKYDLVIPKSAYGPEPLCAVYARSSLPMLEEQIRMRQWSLKTLIPRLKTNIIDEVVVRQYDPEAASFFNINTEDSYAQALSMRDHFLPMTLTKRR